MANVDNPHGFRPLMRNLDGGEPRIEEYDKDASEATAIFPFDIVSREADGNIAPGGTPGTTRYQGVALEYGAAATATKHLVIESPNAVFEAQDNADTDGIAAADLGLNANAEFNAGNLTKQQSGHEIDESSAAATATLDLKLLRLLKTPDADNDFGANARIEVVINKHILREGAGI